MSLEQTIKSAIAYKGLSQAKIAEKMIVKGKPMAAANFNNKLKRNSFSQKELDQIAKAIDAKYVYGFEFKDGTKIYGKE